MVNVPFLLQPGIQVPGRQPGYRNIALQPRQCGEPVNSGFPPSRKHCIKLLFLPLYDGKNHPVRLIPAVISSGWCKIKAYGQESCKKYKKGDDGTNFSSSPSPFNKKILDRGINTEGKIRINNKKTLQKNRSKDLCFFYCYLIIPGVKIFI